MVFVLLCSIIGFSIGITVGCLLYKALHNEQPIGDLRVDESDPEGCPMLFLELKQCPDNLKTRKQVILNVKVENYISQN